MAFRAATFALISAALSAIARGQSYTASVLYPLAWPTGFNSAFPADQAGASFGGQAVGSCNNGADNAFFWSTSGPVNLSTSLPAGTARSYALGTDGGQQAGYSEGSNGSGSDHALLWSGSASAVTDINPTLLSGISASEAFGLCPSQQVGYGSGTATAGLPHAMLWSGTAASAVDLNPTSLGITTSVALGTDGSQQVGSGSSSGGMTHALLWSGSAGTAVDLDPLGLGIASSTALGLAVNQQVGYGSATGGSTHALLWNGSAGSAVDLNPGQLGMTTSRAEGTNGLQQVGFGAGATTAALVWSGTAGSAINLQTLLPANGQWSRSYANSIDSAGNVFGVAQGTLNSVTGYFAVEWSPNQGNGAVDVGRGVLDLPGNSLAAVTGQVRQGYAGGTWNGTAGITSTAAAADASHLTAVGVIQNNQAGSPIYSSSNPFDGTTPGASDVLVKFTYYGDTNLDGKVDGSDYARIDSAYLADRTNPGSATGWFNGDANYDGVIDGSDYTLIDNAFNQQGAHLTDQIASQSASPLVDLATQLASTPTSVPEPNCVLILIPTLATLAHRRRDGATETSRTLSWFRATISAARPAVTSPVRE